MRRCPVLCHRIKRHNFCAVTQKPNTAENCVAARLVPGGDELQSIERLTSYGVHTCSNLVIWPFWTVIKYGKFAYTPSGALSTEGLEARIVRSSSGVIQ